jgi:hypothetical protein
LRGNIPRVLLAVLTGICFAGAIAAIAFALSYR